jgi:transposase InsO family protein
VWADDVSYVGTWQSCAHLATAFDVASRRMVGWALADHMEVSLVCDALRMALAHRRLAPGQLFHSQRCSQYTSVEFRAVLKDHYIIQSLSRPGQCWENAAAESWLGTC